jgi:hypothetical protein
MNPQDADPLYVPEEPTRQERRALRLDKRPMVVQGKSVFLLRELAGRAVQRRRTQRRKRGAKHG